MSMSPKVAMAYNIMDIPTILLITVTIQTFITPAASKLATTDGLMVVVTTNSKKLTKHCLEASIGHL